MHYDLLLLLLSLLYMTNGFHFLSVDRCRYKLIFALTKKRKERSESSRVESSRERYYFILGYAKIAGIVYFVSFSVRAYEKNALITRSALVN